jgi:type I restriction-modification system DNA methylase subunit
MLVNNSEKFEILSRLIKDLWVSENKIKGLELGINIANEVIRILGVPDSEIDPVEDVLNRAFPNAKFKNQKMETWFERHPFFGSARLALQHYDKSTFPVETKFYQLNENFSKARVSATTQIEPNWEDSELTMLPEYKVGIDFILDSKAKSLSIIVSKKGNLRVLELNERLTNTQIEIFKKLSNCFKVDGISLKSKEEQKLEPQRTIHQTLWSSFELKEVNKKFYIGIADLFEELSSYLETQELLKKSTDDVNKQSKQFSNRLIGRILFLWFLNKKGVLSDKHSYFEVNSNSSDYYEKLKVLFYEVLNTPIEQRNKKYTNDFYTPYLNGGLFEPNLSDWSNKDFKFPDKWFEKFFSHLNEFNFTTDESSPEYEQIAIDPEMLGRVFENLLASIVPETSKAASERKNKGAFYTPREIVSFMCKEALKEHINNYVINKKDIFGVEKLIEMSDSEFLDSKSTGLSLIWGNRSEEIKEKIIESLNNLKVLDPACGSGAFPIGFMQLMVKTLERLSTTYDEKLQKHRLAKSNEKFNIHSAKLSILKNSLYGVDIEPMAIEISKLRAWLSLVIDQDKKIEPLPNLEFNFVCANSLIPLPIISQKSLFENDKHEDSIEKLIEKYFQSNGFKEKLKLRNEFNKLYEERFDNYSISERAKLLRTWNPFKLDRPSDFFDSKTMMNVEKFDLVIGNPPYIHFEDIKELSDSIYKPLHPKIYETFEPKGDIYTLFFEMGMKAIKKNGTLALITSNKYLRASYGEKLRSYLIKYNPLKLIDLGSGVFESATVDTSIIITKNEKYSNNTLALSIDSGSKNVDLLRNNIYFDVDLKKNNMWILLNKIESIIKEKLEANAKPLKEYPGIYINIGVLTGFNEAFIIDKKTKDKLLKEAGNSESKKLEKIILPVLRGRDVRKDRIVDGEKYIIFFHNGYTNENNEFVDRENIADFPYLKTYFDSFGDKFFNRYNQGTTPYNLRSCDYIKFFFKPKITYSEIVKSPQFYLDEKNYIPEASCFFLVSQNQTFLKDYLNSEITGWIFKKFYAGGGLGNTGYRYKKKYFENLPTPVLKHFDNTIFSDYFKLSKEEISYIISSLK